MSLAIPHALSLDDLARHVRASRGMAHKQDIAEVARRLGPPAGAVLAGDDCAAIPDGDGYLLFAIEGFLNDFVAAEPFFAGYCGLMVNLSDIAAMGGRPLAVVDAIWSEGPEGAALVLEGLRQASITYGVPVVGGHTNLKSPHGQFAVSVLGRAKRLITSFDAGDGDVLIAAIDQRGCFRGQSFNWDASSQAPAARLRDDLEILPALAEAGLVTAGKDISMAGVVGSAMMLLETSGRGAWIDVDAIPCPPDIPLERFLLAFPSYGFVLTARAQDAGAAVARFHARGIASSVIGATDNSRRVRLRRGQDEAVLWDFAQAFTGWGPARPSQNLD